MENTTNHSQHMTPFVDQNVHKDNLRRHPTIQFKGEYIPHVAS